MQHRVFIRNATALAVFACASLILLVPASAQSVYGSIFGTVTDKTGAAVAGASITVKDEAKGTVVAATSNGSGDYSVPHLISDVYDLKVTAKGFKSFETKGISVQADTAPRIDPILEVGGGNETIEVNSDSQPELKTDRADISTVFDQQQVSSLPVGDQNFTNLQLLLPGAQLLGWAHAADENPQGSKQIMVDGQAFGGVAFELDGTDNEDPLLGIIVINPAMDAVTETKITTQNFDAELGKAVSAVVTAQTKSGTNSFHGSAYDFRTGNANEARDPFTEAPGSIPAGLKNRFGGSIGGPVLKNKFFFFGNYEAQRQKIGTAATDTLPTNLLTETALGKEVGPSGIPGADFSEYLTQLGNAGAIYQQTSSGPVPYSHNVIPTGQLSAPALALLTYLEPYTKGIALGIGGSDNGLDSNYHATGTGLFNSNQWTARGDYALNEQMHAFARFSRFTDVLTGTVMFGDAGGPGFGINNYGGNSIGANDSLASGMDIAINPKLLTDFRLAYFRYNIIDSKHDQNAEFAKTLGIPGINTGAPLTGGSPGFAIATVPGGGTQQGGNGGTQPLYGDGLNINRCNCPLTEHEDQFQIVNNWTKEIGNHSIKVGTDLRYGRNLRVPSDNDRDGLLNFASGPTSNPSVATPGGLGFASFLLGEVTSFNRYVSNANNAKEFQKRTFFYGQDTWRATRSLTLNLGLRWDLYFPETVNAAGNGALLDLTTGYMNVAGIGGVRTDMGSTIEKAKQFAPRLGATYQLDSKTVVRAGYGRSFDNGQFGVEFGMYSTQNLPVLANQSINAPTNTGEAFALSTGPQAYVFPTVPANGLLPNPGYAISSRGRANPLHPPTIDAWNLSVQRALTPTLTLTAAYVGTKGTHTFADSLGSITNPNEAAINLPAAYSVNGQSLHYDPSVVGNTIASNGGTSNSWFLQRYYGGSLPACKDANYISPQAAGYTEPYVTTGMCGWTQGVSDLSDDQNTHFNALQVTLAQQFSKGLAMTGNYQWASATDYNDTFNTWDRRADYEPDSNVRKQQLTMYGSYDLPFGKGKPYAPNAGRAVNLIIGGFQLSSVLNWAGGLPFSLTYNEASANVPASAPNYPSLAAGAHLKTSLSGFVSNGNGTGTRTYYQAQTLGGGTFVDPGLDNIGNVGYNSMRGPGFFNTDLAITKAFTIRENIVTKFRMDAFNGFNHINPGNPSGNIESVGAIGGESAGGSPRQLEFSLRLQF